MPSRFDNRYDPEAKELLKKLPKVRHQPLVAAADLREVAKVFEALPDLSFPINSAGELIDKLGGGGEKAFSIAGVDVDPVRMIKYMPAYYFPIASSENFVEKMAELVRSNRKQTDVPKALTAVKKQLPKLKYPISTADELHKALQGTKTVKFNNKAFNTKEMVGKVNSGFFPLDSQEDFDRKVSQLIATRELIVKD